MYENVDCMKKTGIQVLKVKVKTNTNHIARRMKKITNCFYIYLTLVNLSQNPPQKYAKFHGAIYLINQFDSTILCGKAQNQGMMNIQYPVYYPFYFPS